MTPGFLCGGNRLLSKKIGIVCDQDTIVFPCCSKDIFIATPAKVHIGDVFGIVAIALQNLRNVYAHAFINQKSRLPAMAQVELAPFFSSRFVKFFPRHTGILRKIGSCL